MKLPVFTIIGRPNVGKSTLFNKIAKKRKAIVSPEPGMTRDRNYENVEYYGKNFLLVDTGGFTESLVDPFNNLIKSQIFESLKESDVIFFVVDGIDGILKDDFEIAKLIRECKVPVVLVMNKSDVKDSQFNLPDFYKLGFDKPESVSAEHSNGIVTIIEKAFSLIKNSDFEHVDEKGIGVSILGRANVGKSLLLNHLLQKNRSLVSEIPGTTRDPIDSFCIRGDYTYRFIDTAGIRKRSRKSISRNEVISMLFSYRSILRSDLCILMIDANEGPLTIDSQIASQITESGKSCLIAINKWDMLEKETKTFKEMVLDIREKLPQIKFAPILSISALTGLRCEKLFDLIHTSLNASKRRISTSILNDHLKKWIASHPPPYDYSGKRTPLLYATQISVEPPHFIFFLGKIRKSSFTQYGRYLENRIRDDFDYEGSSIKVSFRSK